MRETAFAKGRQHLLCDLGTLSNPWKVYICVSNPLHHLHNDAVLTFIVLLHLQNGLTPLHAAAKGGHLDCLNLLLDNWADIEAKDKVIAGPTALACRTR